MKTLFFVLAVLSIVFGLSEKEYQDGFSAWMTKYSRSYVSMEEQNERFQIFKSNLDLINEHNSKNLGYTLRANRFADITTEEYNRMLSRSKRSIHQPVFGMAIPTLGGGKNGFVPPSSINWTEKGVVSPVQQESECAEGWAFTAAGATESCNAIQNGGKLVLLSSQNLIDCVGGGNCDGGPGVEPAFQYIISNGGLDTEASYPAGNPGPCKFNPNTIGGTLTGQRNVLPNDEKDLQNYVALGPVAVEIDASPLSFQLYDGGIYSDPTCNNSTLDTTALVVGYGYQGNADYWIVRNNWGVDWGIDGYILIARNKGNMCGIAASAIFPIC
jgi:cathepsin L